MEVSGHRQDVTVFSHKTSSTEQKTSWKSWQLLRWWRNPSRFMHYNAQN